MATRPVRTPWQVTVHVWYALFLREAMARVTADRVAWLWLLAEPIAHVLLMVWIRTLLGRIRLIPGADFVPWLVVGITAFILFRNQMNRGMNAISANRAMFAYRQVKPVDTVLARCTLEGVLSTMVLMLMVLIFTLLDQDILPHHPLAVAGYWLLFWGFGLGVGLICSVAVTVLPEVQRFISMLSFPLYFLSGVIFPVQYFPHEIRHYLLYNPLVHMLELVRGSFFETYRMVEGVSLLYPAGWTLGALFLGLLLHVRFKYRLMAQ